MPERFVEMGMPNRTPWGVAAGLSLTGKSAVCSAARVLFDDALAGAGQCWTLLIGRQR
jgi:transketolase C-terminal domain/subunit